MPHIVYAFCRSAGDRYLASIGRGVAQQRSQWQHRVTQTGSVVKHAGEGWHAKWLPTEKVYLVEVDADHWKSWLHQRLATAVGQPGAMTLFRAQPHEHLALARHLTAEVRTEQFIAGKGVVTRWERQRRQNHWLDAMYIACAAAHGCGMRLMDEGEAPQPPVPPRAAERDSGRRGGGDGYSWARRRPRWAG